FGVTGKGNFVDHSDPNPLPHQNVLSVVKPLPLLHSPEKPLTRPSGTLSPSDGEREGVSGSDENLSKDSALLTSAKKKMFAARSRRVRPHLDDKVLASWNGLMLGALARAYAVLGDENYRAAAEKNVAFLQAKLWDAKTKTLYHRWRDGARDNVQLLEAYSSLLAGVIDLYEATLEPKHLDFAIALAQAMLAKFYDAENGGFWQSAAGAKDLILRVKEDYDGAEPSGNSVAILALQNQVLRAGVALPEAAVF